VKRTSAPFHGCPFPFPTTTWRGIVVDVIDGDTFTIQIDRGWFDTSTFDVRLSDADALELTSGTVAQKAAAREALLWFLARADGRWCVLRTAMDAEKYGRVLATIDYLGADGAVHSVSAELRTRGWAKPAPEGT